MRGSEVDVEGSVKGSLVLTVFDEGGRECSLKPGPPIHGDFGDGTSGIEMFGEGNRNSRTTQFGNEARELFDHEVDLEVCGEQLFGRPINVGLVLQENVQSLFHRGFVDAVDAKDEQGACPVNGF